MYEIIQSWSWSKEKLVNEVVTLSKQKCLKPDNIIHKILCLSLLNIPERNGVINIT